MSMRSPRVSSSSYSKRQVQDDVKKSNSGVLTGLSSPRRHSSSRHSSSNSSSSRHGSTSKGDPSTTPRSKSHGVAGFDGEVEPPRRENGYIAVQPLHLGKGFSRKRSAHKEFELLDTLGTGSFGAVYHAVHKSTQRHVALKCIARRQDDDTVQKELDAQRACDSDYITRIYGCYRHDSQLFLVMEYCSVGSVNDLMRVAQPHVLDEYEIACVVKCALNALLYMHEQARQIHRDVKTDNLLLTHWGEVKLADFGVVGQLDSDESRRQTIAGTPYFIAPEILDGSEKGYNHLADIWSLGICCIEMAEGNPPHYQEHPMRVLTLITTAKPPTLANAEFWSEDMHAFLRIALVKEAKRRPDARRLLRHAFCRLALGPTCMVPRIRYFEQVCRNNGGRQCSLQLCRQGASACKLLATTEEEEARKKQREASYDEWHLGTALKKLENEQKRSTKRKSAQSTAVKTPTVPEMPKMPPLKTKEAPAMPSLPAALLSPKSTPEMPKLPATSTSGGGAQQQQATTTTTTTVSTEHLPPITPAIPAVSSIVKKPSLPSLPDGVVAGEVHTRLEVAISKKSVGNGIIEPELPALPPVVETTAASSNSSASVVDVPERVVNIVIQPLDSSFLDGKTMEFVADENDVIVPPPPSNDELPPPPPPDEVDANDVPNSGAVRSSATSGMPVRGLSARGRGRGRGTIKVRGHSVGVGGGLSRAPLNRTTSAPGGSATLAVQQKSATSSPIVEESSTTTSISTSVALPKLTDKSTEVTQARLPTRPSAVRSSISSAQQRPRSSSMSMRLHASPIESSNLASSSWDDADMQRDGAQALDNESILTHLTGAEVEREALLNADAVRTLRRRQQLSASNERRGRGRGVRGRGVGSSLSAPGSPRGTSFRGRGGMPRGSIRGRGATSAAAAGLSAHALQQRPYATLGRSSFGSYSCYGGSGSPQVGGDTPVLPPKQVLNRYSLRQSSHAENEDDDVSLKSDDSFANISDREESSDEEDLGAKPVIMISLRTDSTIRRGMSRGGQVVGGGSRFNTIGRSTGIDSEFSGRRRRGRGGSSILGRTNPNAGSSTLRSMFNDAKKRFSKDKK